MTEETAPSRYREGTTESPWDAMRESIAAMSRAGIPVWEQNATLRDGLKDLTRRAIAWHQDFGRKP